MTDTTSSEFAHSKIPTLRLADKLKIQIDSAVIKLIVTSAYAGAGTLTAVISLLNDHPTSVLAGALTAGVNTYLAIDARNNHKNASDQLHTLALAALEPRPASPTV